jgi:hypothetical protein
MATVSKVFTPSDIFQGPADVYFDLQAPVSAVPPTTVGTHTIALDGLGQPTGTFSYGAISAATLGGGGSGYAVGDILTVVQSGGSNGLIRVLTISGGAVLTFRILHGGSGYSTGTGLATTGGTGAGCTIDITTISPGLHMGLTEGPCTVSFTASFNEILADQYAAPIDAAYISSVAEIDFAIKELDLTKFSRYFSGLLTGSYYDLPIGSTNPAADMMQIGNSISLAANTHTVMLVAPRRDAPGKYVYAFAYKAVLSAAWQWSLQRKKEAVFQFKFRCIGDPNREPKDQVMQIVRTT